MRKMRVFETKKPKSTVSIRVSSLGNEIGYCATFQGDPARDVLVVLQGAQDLKANRVEFKAKAVFKTEQLREQPQPFWSHQNKNKINRSKFNISSVKNSINFGVLNARSVNNKTESVVDFVLEHKLDILCITGTWLQSEDRFTTNHITPSGYSMISSPRLSRRGGGIALVIKDVYSFKKLASASFCTFEVLLIQLIAPSKSFLIATIYRPPGSLGNFLTELSDLISTLIAKYSDFILAGDFNIHVDTASDESSKKLSELLKNFSLKQHVKSATHIGRHTLDLVISKANTQLVQEVSVVEGISDHQGILVDLNVATQKRSVVSKTFHQFKKLDIVKFQQDILSSELYSNPSSDVDALAEQYHHVVSSLVDKHVPVITRTVTSRPPAPWYTQEIALARQKRRQLERHWRRTKLTVDREIFVAQKLLVNSMLANAKVKYYADLVKNQSHNPRQLWETINSLSGNIQAKVLPANANITSLVNDFNLFFTNKVTQIRANIGVSDEFDGSTYVLNSVLSNMSVFNVVKESEISQLLKHSPSKSCSLDPIPTHVLKNCETIVSPLTKLVNISLSTGSVPKCFKHALVTPLIKNTKLDSNSMSGYRPISNLLYSSKLLERCVSKQLNNYLSSSALYEAYQSAYRPLHSTETALLRVQNDILTNMDNKKITVLVLLDLSSAFDTVDHTILLNRLKNIGITGLVHDWFSSYLSDRTQAVFLDGVTSDSVNLTCGIPQGSVLGPILFNIYTHPLGEIARKHGMKCHFYADDTQLYTSFSVNDSSTSTKLISDCIADIRSWMQSNLLKLNESKTEVVMIGTKQQLSKVGNIEISVRNVNIRPCSKVRNLGVIFDYNMAMVEHVNSVCKASYFYIRLLGKLRKFLDKSTAAMLTHAFATSRLDYCNFLLHGISKAVISRL